MRITWEKQLEDKIIHLEKNKIDTDSINKIHKEFIKANHAIDDKIRDETLQDDLNRKAAKMSALLSGKIDKYEYLTGKKILPPD